MTTPELIEYITKEKSAGKSQQVITDVLKANGWLEKDIQEGFAKINTPPVVDLSAQAKKPNYSQPVVAKTDAHVSSGAIKHDSGIQKNPTDNSANIIKKPIIQHPANQQAQANIKANPAMDTHPAKPFVAPEIKPMQPMVASNPLQTKPNIEKTQMTQPETVRPKPFSAHPQVQPSLSDISSPAQMQKPAPSQPAQPATQPLVKYDMPVGDIQKQAPVSAPDMNIKKPETQESPLAKEVSKITNDIHQQPTADKKPLFPAQPITTHVQQPVIKTAPIVTSPKPFQPKPAVANQPLQKEMQKIYAADTSKSSKMKKSNGGFFGKLIKFLFIIILLAAAYLVGAWQNNFSATPRLQPIFEFLPDFPLTGDQSPVSGIDSKEFTYGDLTSVSEIFTKSEQAIANVSSYSFSGFIKTLSLQNQETSGQAEISGSYTKNPATSEIIITDSITGNGASSRQVDGIFYVELPDESWVEGENMDEGENLFNNGGYAEFAPEFDFIGIEKDSGLSYYHLRAQSPLSDLAIEKFSQIPEIATVAPDYQMIVDVWIDVETYLPGKYSLYEIIPQETSTEMNISYFDFNEVLPIIAPENIISLPN